MRCKAGGGVVLLCEGEKQNDLQAGVKSCKQEGEAASSRKKPQAAGRSCKQKGEAASRREKPQAEGRSNIYLTSRLSHARVMRKEAISNMEALEEGVSLELGFNCGQQGKETLR